MGIDFIERRRMRSHSGGGGAKTISNGVMSSPSVRMSVNGGSSSGGDHHQLVHPHHNHVNNGGFYRNRNKVLIATTAQGSQKGSNTNGNGYYCNQNNGAGGDVIRNLATSPRGDGHVPVQRAFLSYTTVSPTTSPPLVNGSSCLNGNSNHSPASPPATTASTTTTTTKPSRTLSVRNFSNFVKRLPSLSLSPSVRIASSLGFSSANNHSSSNGVTSPTGEQSASGGPQSLGCNGNTATLKRPTVSFQKKKARPFSYAEPGSLSRPSILNGGSHTNGILHNNSHLNGTVSNGAGPSGNSHLDIPVTNLSPTLRNQLLLLDSLGMGEDELELTYNGYNVADLEARLARLRFQQRERRKSLDFAISCVEPDPMYYSVDEQAAGQEVLGIYIKSVVKNGSADVDGRLAAGDQLLSVDGQSLIGISQEEAAKYLVRTGPVVTLEVAKQAALYHGLATMLNQPSPELSRGKGDGADLSFDEDDEYSGDDMEYLEASGGNCGGRAGYSKYHLSPYYYPQQQYPQHYNSHNDMRSSPSSSTLLAVPSSSSYDNMHLLSPPRPSEDFLRRPTAFPHHLQIGGTNNYQQQQQRQQQHSSQGYNYTQVQQQGYGYESATPINSSCSGVNKMKLVRQLSFPQEEDEEEEEEEEEDDTEQTISVGNVMTTEIAALDATPTNEGDIIGDNASTEITASLGNSNNNENDNDESTSSSSSSSEISTTSNEIDINSSLADTSTEKTITSDRDGTVIHNDDGDDNENDDGINSLLENNDLSGESKNDDGNEASLEEDKVEEMTENENENDGTVTTPVNANANTEINNKYYSYSLMKKKALSLPHCCTFVTGLALSPTAHSCTNLIAMSSSQYMKHCRNSEDEGNGQDIWENTRNAMNGNGKRRATLCTTTGFILTGFSLGDIKLSKKARGVSPSKMTEEDEASSNALQDSNYWSSNCSTRDDNSTLYSPGGDSTVSSNGGGGLMRASQSDSSLAKWTDSFEALSRRGLSESALGVPRVVGSSRLLKFLINTYNNNNGGGGESNNFCSYEGDQERGRKKSTSSIAFLQPRSKSSDAILVCGFNAPRRMSERDLPSKILREQNHGMAVDHPIPGGQYGHDGGGVHPMMMQPRIHSSKSVPSLNSDGPSVGGMQPGGNNQMMRSPTHVPNNVANNVMSGHHLMHGQQNHINDSPNGPRYPQGYPNMSMTMQHGSKSSMMGGMAGNHVNNVNAQQTEAMRSRSIQSLADPPHRPDIGNKQPSTPALHMQQHEDTERFYQNVGFYPPPPPPPTNPANMPVRTYIPYSNSTGNISSSAAFRSPGGGGNHISPHYPGYPGMRAPPPNLNSSVPSNLNWQQQQQRVNHTGHLPPQQQQHLQQNHGGVSRDLLRQEAKMLEMQDELRRREERAALMMSKQQMTSTQQRYSQQYPSQQQQRPISGAGGPPAPAPKPYRVGESQEIAPGRPPLPDEFKHSSQGAFSYNNGIVSKNALVTNPWDREAKEAEAKRRKEAAKYWREQQITDLESFPTRTSDQDKELRALKLEREFQRRAEEAQRNDDEGAEEDEDEEDDRKAMVRRLQEDLERTRISSNGNSKLDPMEEERARKIEEMRRKKMELEAAQAAEERLVREAAKRREEELRRQHQLMQQQSQSLKHHQSQQMHLQQQQQQQQQQAHHQLNQHHQPPQSLSYQSPYRSSYTSKLSPPGSTNPAGVINENHLNASSSIAAAPPLPKSPPPSATTYKSAMQQSSSSPQKSPVTPPQSSPKPKSDKKTVSFNETVATNEPPASPEEEEEQDIEKVREDPNKFLTEATALLQSPRSPDVTIGSGSTPGVIGAQEVYRDPRMRRLAEQQQKQQASSTPKPEKLTFKEKMRMFAMESGDIESPKDKVKSSKAQREIESPQQIAAAAAAAAGNSIPK